MAAYILCMNYEAAAAYALGRLRKELPENYYYHAVNHTIDVLQAIEYLGKGEQVSEADFVLLRTAAAFHDIGFVEIYTNHEPAGARIAGEVLPQFGYSEQDIKTIQQLINVTALPSQPTNLLEMIIRDADLDYLGREDYLLISHQLKLEWHKRGMVKTMREWYELQYQFMKQHAFYTGTARAHRNAGKELYLEQLRNLLGLDGVTKNP